MPSRWKSWLIVKIWTLKYYLENPNMFKKRMEGRVNRMIDRDHDSIDWAKLINWIGMATIGGIWWWSVFSKGIGVTMIWTIVVIALVALWLRMSGRV